MALFARARLLIKRKPRRSTPERSRIGIDIIATCTERFDGIAPAANSLPAIRLLCRRRGPLNGHPFELGEDCDSFANTVLFVAA